MNHTNDRLPRVAATLGALLLLVASTVGHAEAGRALGSFEAGAVQDQLDLDVTPVPAGLGALFVPTMTEPGLEPVVLVYREAGQVASARTGQRIVLPPGNYRVVVGHGATDARASLEVTVLEGVTTPVAPFYAGLRITSVNDRDQAVASTYILRNRTTGKRFGPLKTVTTGDYRDTPTWLLPPGHYEVALGGDPDAGRGVVTVSLHAGELLRYRLVVDEDDEEVLLRTEFAEREAVPDPKIWRFRWVVGGDVSFSQSSDPVGAFRGDSIRLGAFTRASGGIDHGNHLALATLSLEETWLGLNHDFGQSLPFQNIDDEAELELFYNYRVGRIFGPYARAMGRTSFFEREFFAPEDDTRVEVSKPDGGTHNILAARGEGVTLLPSFAPLVLQQGAGVSATAIDNKVVSFIVRTGPAARQSFYRAGRFYLGHQGDTIRLQELEDSQLYGGEFTVVAGLRLGDNFSLETSFDAFVPGEQLGDLDTFEPVYRWDNTLSVSLSRFAALVYLFELHRDDLAFEDVQVSHNISLRLQHTLF